MIVIVRAPGGSTEYFTLDKLYIAGSPFGAWCNKAEHAFRFGRKHDAERFQTLFLGQINGTHVVEVADA